MKYMPAIAAATVDTQPSLEADADLSLEGIVDKVTGVIKTLKAKFSSTDEEKLKAEITAKLAILAKQRKVLEKSKSAVSTAKDNGQHEIKTSRISHTNFSATTAGEVVAGMAKNRKLVLGALSRLKNARSKVELQTIHDGLEAEFAKKGRIAAKISASRGEALKVLDEALAMNEASARYCQLMTEAHEHQQVSTEGFGGAIAGGLQIFMIIVIAVIAGVIGYLVTIYLWAMIFAAPFIGIPLMILWFAFLIAINNPGHEEEHAQHLLRESH